MGDFTALIGPVTQYRATDVGNHVHMGGASSIMAWKDGSKLRDAVCIGRLQPAQEGVVQVSGIVVVAVAVTNDLGVSVSGGSEEEQA